MFSTYLHSPILYYPNPLVSVYPEFVYLSMEDYDYIVFLKKMKDKISKFETTWSLSNIPPISLFDMDLLATRCSYVGKLQGLMKRKVFSVEQIRELYKLISSKDEQARKLGMGIIDGRVLAKKRNKNGNKYSRNS
jgi:hypothetical protein